MFAVEFDRLSICGHGNSSGILGWIGDNSIVLAVVLRDRRKQHAEISNIAE